MEFSSPAAMRRGGLANQDMVLVEQGLIGRQVKGVVFRRSCVRVDEVDIAIPLSSCGQRSSSVGHSV